MDIKKFDNFNENKENVNYMFFANLQHICRMASEMMEMDESEIDQMLIDGHDWANDHISKSMESISHVYNFLHSSDIDGEHNMDTAMDFKEIHETEDENQETEVFNDELLEESIKKFNKFK
jgi:hypothetical protein